MTKNPFNDFALSSPTHARRRYTPLGWVLTEYLDGVRELARLQGGDLTHVVARVLSLHVADLQVVAVHQAHALVRRNLHGSRSEHCDATLPYQHEGTCNNTKTSACDITVQIELCKILKVSEITRENMKQEFYKLITTGNLIRF